MTVRFIIPAYRCRLGHEHKRGDECELPDHVALKVIRLGYAEAVRAPEPEVVVPTPPANAAKRTGKSQPRRAI